MFLRYLITLLPSAVGFALLNKSKLKLVFAATLLPLLFLYEGINFYLSGDTARVYAAVIPVAVFVTVYYLTRLFLMRRKGALALGIPAAISLCFGAAASYVNFSNTYVRKGMFYNSLYRLNALLQGGVSRAGIDAAGDLILSLLTLLLLLLPIILIIIVSAREDKTNQP